MHLTKIVLAFMRSIIPSWFTRITVIDIALFICCVFWKLPLHAIRDYAPLYFFGVSYISICFLLLKKSYYHSSNPITMDFFSLIFRLAMVLYVIPVFANSCLLPVLLAIWHLLEHNVDLRVLVLRCHLSNIYDVLTLNRFGVTTTHWNLIIDRMQASSDGQYYTLRYQAQYPEQIIVRVTHAVAGAGLNSTEIAAVASYFRICRGVNQNWSNTIAYNSYDRGSIFNNMRANG